jgi:hypothetical protein
MLEQYETYDCTLWAVYRVQYGKAGGMYRNYWPLKG